MQSRRGGIPETRAHQIQPDAFGGYCARQRGFEAQTLAYLSGIDAQRRGRKNGSAKRHDPRTRKPFVRRRKQTVQPAFSAPAQGGRSRRRQGSRRQRRRGSPDALETSAQRLDFSGKVHSLGGGNG